MCLATCQFRNETEEIDVVDVLDLDESPSFEVCCDSCDRWYHGSCVGITQEYARSINIYTCPPCETEAKAAKSRKIFVILRPQVPHDSSSSSSVRAVEIKTPLLDNNEDEEPTPASQSKKKTHSRRKRKRSADPDWIGVEPRRQSESTPAPGKAGIDEADDIWIYQSEDDNAIGDDDEEEQNGDKKAEIAGNCRSKRGPDLQQSPGSHQRVKITLATTPPGRGDSRAMASPRRTGMKTRSQRDVGSAANKEEAPAPSGSAPFATLNHDCLTTVFSFLDALDLCRSVQVCRHWRDVGEHGSLWKRVNVRLSSIGDWSHLARFLLAKKTLRQLSLQGDTRNHAAWDLKPLSQLKQVTRLYLHEAPVEVAHRIPELMPHLTVFWCENILFSIGDYSIDFGRFKHLPKLTELCIHSPEPFQLPAFSFQGSISQLKSLTSLTTLVISNIEGQVFNEFSFLRSLRNLTSLTVGFCFEWTHDTYESVSDLKNLRYLSLNGLPVKMEDAGLDLSLVSCLTHFAHLEELELIDFFIPQAIVNKPGTLRNLQSLRLIDSSQSQTGQEKLTVIQHLNYERTLSLLKSLESLRALTWHAHGALVYLEEADRWQEDVAVILPRTLCELQGHGEFASC